MENLLQMKIYLNFIMKNEQAVLKRMLDSVIGLVDGCVCVDTGSTDNSMQIVEDYFKKHNKPCYIYEWSFVNFSDARNHAIERLKGKADFGFYIDCDEQLVLHDNFDIDKLKSELSNHDFGIANTISGTIHYSRYSFYRASLPLIWKGAVHEFLTCSTATRNYTVKNLHTFVPNDGDDPSEKFLAHAKILLKEVELHNDPRDIFYLANSYKDAGDNESAISWYRKRVDIKTGFYEERYFSQLMIGLLTSHTKPYQDALAEYMKCSELDDLMADHFLNSIILLQQQGLWHTAFILSSHCIRKFHKKKPTGQRNLFIHAETYDFKLLNVHKKNCEKLNMKNPDDILNSHPSAWTGHRSFAEWIVDKTNPEVIVDLGIDWGFSTFSLALAGKGKVYGIDLFEGDEHAGRRDTYDSVLSDVDSLKNFGIDNIEIIKDDFNNVAKSWDKTINILHIDGLHTYEAVKNDYLTWSKFLSADGIILIHNTQSYEGVKKFFNEIDLPKFEFHHSAGLGVICKNKSIIEQIQNKYDEEITIGYIQHSKDAQEKYLRPSLENLKGRFHTLSTSDENMPATNYNNIVEGAETRLVLLVHEDVTFGTDFLIKIKEVVAAHPDFGAIGAVGIDPNGEYRWGSASEIKVVEQLDCCCILINKDNFKLKFDEKTFNDFHFYVEDYCLQARDKGLKCYTIPVDCQEGKADESYQLKDGYFSHHSATCNERGFCWGKYPEYKVILDKKWKVEVDVCIVSFAKNKALQDATEYGIKTLLESEDNIQFNVFVVESNPNVHYNHLPNTTTLWTDKPFNYNGYLNYAISHGSAPYTVLCNNDLSYKKGWASEIINAMKQYPALMSASPFCPETQKTEDWNKFLVHYGYMIRQQLAGWCIFQKREVLDRIGGLSEDVDFWYSDNIYADQLQKHGINHGLVSTSVVHHHENNIGKTASTLTPEEQENFTVKQGEKYHIAKLNLDKK